MTGEREAGMKYNVSKTPSKTHKISKNVHSVMFEYFGNTIYDGIWVGKDSDIENIDGIRKDVIDGCNEIGIGTMRWPGGCCADHYHWKSGIGKDRPLRYFPMPDTANKYWRHDFGTDEFMKFCELTGAEPFITINTATGTPEEFLDWYEYVNGDTNTKYGKLRAENGHPEPYNVKYWAIGNTDENVWHIDFNNPQAYAQDYRRFQTVVRDDRENLFFIGLGLSSRHQLPGWVVKSLDHITHYRRQRGPDALSIHHYLGGMKQGGERCGDSVEYNDDNYYALLDLLDRYQHDIDIHRTYIADHTNSQWPTKISFDEWGAWHPEATVPNNQRQHQTMRDAIFAALALHIFYKNSDIVEFAMETQLSNLLQSLFETDGAMFYKTPTFYVMKLFREHMEQRLLTVLPDEVNPDIDVVASASENGSKITVSIVNRHLYNNCKIDLNLGEQWRVVKADIVSCSDVHDFNSYDEPEKICDKPFAYDSASCFDIPAHSIVRICFEN